MPFFRGLPSPTPGAADSGCWAPNLYPLPGAHSSEAAAALICSKGLDAQIRAIREEALEGKAGATTAPHYPPRKAREAETLSQITDPHRPTQTRKQEGAGEGQPASISDSPVFV